MKRLAGFTLIEMMVVIAILGVLLAIGIPSFQQLIVSNRIASNANEIIADLMMARSEALKRGGDVIVTVCATTDGNSCSGANDWSRGRLVFVDSTTVGVIGSVDAGEVVLRKAGASDGGVIVAAGGFSTVGFVTYRSSGSVTSLVPGAFTVCKSGYLGRVVSVSIIGRASLSQTAGNCS